MEVKIGKIITTHGIKGEIRIRSNFSQKELVFKAGNCILIGETRQKEIIKTYRIHKNYDMITLENYIDINQVLNFLGKNVYYELESNDNYVMETLINYKIISNNIIIGMIVDVFDSGGGNFVFEINNNTKKYFMPAKDEFIKNVDKEKTIVFVDVPKGMFE